MLEKSLSEEQDKHDFQEKLVDELESENVQPLNAEQLKRVTDMVNDYKGRIKTHLIEQQEKRSKWSERLADQIACFGGSWAFIVYFSVFLALWMIWNLVVIPLRFDDPPFILLNLFLSTLSAFQAPVILMSQNRQAARDKQESVLSFAINYQAEKENIDIQKRLDRIERHLDKLVGRLEPEKQGDCKQSGNF
ncbi:DUF1003 domain-containing protein [Paenibacillus radicis (ex Xue et al. 2023)]|uniref:DUF1003 domain-containing protein n=1 Tax=Paenibacillus radicis (ex Xue et al. 2023) TaxID=2972489 RepID=A0ABT1YS79_9BACL|nr:DUF1003 domain-containing protein [Paenibacillus radicis (ex Xue et al. 2023)]MCR8636037.1 DUF1003 domain-containing protein [Paenibacillus radicis (ex Xue et al. 2023)]